MSSPAARSISGGGNRRQPSRLQRRAPPPIQISHAEPKSWKLAIPLLSPPESPPPPSPPTNQLAAAETTEQRRGREAEKPPVFKKWQHPAAPFYYQPAPSAQPFVASPN